MSNTERTVSIQEEWKGCNFPSLMELSEDLRKIFVQELLTDIVLSVNGNDIRCHKAILSNRSKWFSMKIHQICTQKGTIIELDENSVILDAVLVYIYTGNLRLLEAMNIPLIDLRAAAEKYGLSSLKKIVTNVIKSNRNTERKRSIEFIWQIKIASHISFIADCAAMKEFTLRGNDMWGLEIESRSSENGTCVGIYLTRYTTDKNVKTIHFVDISVHVINSLGAKYLSFKREVPIGEDGKHKLAEFDPQTEQRPGLLPQNDTLTFACELTVSDQDSECFQLKGKYQRYISNELINLSQDMYQMLKFGKYTDISIQLKGNTLLQVHSYILLGRLQLLPSCLGKLGDKAGFSSLVWRSFVFFLYTGQIRYLDDHVKAIYCALQNLRLTESSTKYSKMLATNFNVSNSFDILCEAVKYEDKDLMISAAYFLARSSKALTDPENWISIATNNPNNEILRKQLL